MTYLAGTIINNVRDLAPDPVYSDVGVAQPDADGPLWRAQTLYRWLDDGVRLMQAYTGYVLTDWWAIATVANAAQYAVSPNFLLIDAAYHKQTRLRLSSYDQADEIVPARGTEAQADSAYIFRTTGYVDIGIKPVPSASDPATTITGNISASVTTIPVASVTNFLSFGYLLIGTELIQYQNISTLNLTACNRGVGGTTAAAHTSGDAVTHCSIWLRGTRVPGTISDSTSVVEVPLPWVSFLNDYLLAQCRLSEQEYSEGQRLMRQFENACEGIREQFSGKSPITKKPERRGDDGVTLPAKMRQAPQPAQPGLAGLLGG